MTLFTFDGFELDKTSTAVLLRYPGSSGIPATLPDMIGRFGGKAYRAEVDQVLRITHDEARVSGIYRLGFALQIGTLDDPDPEVTFIQIRNTSNIITMNMLVRRDAGEPGFKLKVIRHANVSGNDITEFDSAEILGFGAWHYLELEADLSNTASGITLKINDDTVVETSVVATDMTEGFEQTRIRFRPAAGSYQAVDDLHISDDQFPFLGSRIKISSLAPVDDAGPNDWIPSSIGPHHEMVDDGLTGESDGDTTHVISTSIGDKEIFELTKPSNMQGRMHSTRLAQDGEATVMSDPLQPILKTSQENPLDTKILTTGAYSHHSEVSEVDPADNSLWDVDQLKDIEVGFEVPIPPAGGNLGLEILLEDGISVGTLPLTAGDELPLMLPIQPSADGLVGEVVANKLPITTPTGGAGFLDLIVI